MTDRQLKGKKDGWKEREKKGRQGEEVLFTVSMIRAKEAPEGIYLSLSCSLGLAMLGPSWFGDCPWHTGTGALPQPQAVGCLYYDLLLGWGIFASA